MRNNLIVDVLLNAPFKFFVYSGGLDVFGHIVNGVLILLFGFAIIWFSFKAENSLAVKLSVLALIFTVSANVNGDTFLGNFFNPLSLQYRYYFSLAMAHKLPRRIYLPLPRL